MLAFFGIGCAAVLFVPAITIYIHGSNFTMASLTQLGTGAGILGWFAFCFAADTLAVIFFGRYLALTSKHPAQAAGLTILFVLILPSAAFCGLDLVADCFFIIWGGSNMPSDLRWRLAVHGQPARM